MKLKNNRVNIGVKRVSKRPPKSKALVSSCAKGTACIYSHITGRPRSMLNRKLSLLTK